VVQKRFNFPEGGVELYAEKVNNRGLCAIAQAESLRYKLLGGLAVRRLCSCLYNNVDEGFCNDMLLQSLSQQARLIAVPDLFRNVTKRTITLHAF
jgi:hypothetical protein